MALFFSTAHPAYSAQRSERVKHGNFPTFLGTLRWKLQIVCQMQLICFWVKKWCISFPHVLNRMVMTLEVISPFFFIYFWHLNWRNESVLHSSISVLKKLSLFSVLTSWMSASILFRSCLAHLIVSLLALIIFFSFLKRCRYHYWLNQAEASKCTQSDAGLCICFESFQSLLSCRFFLNTVLTQPWRTAVHVHRLQQWSLVMVHHNVSVKNYI